ncbi:hypothetical protein LBMAG42_13410 [Deltaproteobacteria bacterium]|nr:hypothetical protein LBMAG42_13410 [Deltaproteobacteria bacterium]
MGLGTWEWGVILLIVLIFFGAGKLPDVFRQAGKGIKAFKDASSGKDEDEDEDEEAAAAAKAKKAKRKELAAKDDLDDDPEEVKARSSAKKDDA